MTMQLIESKTLGSAQASIEFTNIPQDGTDLRILVSGRCAADNNFYLRFNGTTTTYSSRLLRGTGSNTGSASDSSIICVTGYSGRTANTFGNTEIYIPNYAATVQKSVSADCVEENNATESYQTIVAGLWTTTDAISSIQLVGFGNWASGSSASLYKITKGSDGTTTVA